MANRSTTGRGNLKLGKGFAGLKPGRIRPHRSLTISPRATKCNTSNRKTKHDRPWAGAVNTAACMRSEPNSQPAAGKIQIASETSTKVSKCNQIHVVTSWILANGIARHIFISHPKPVIDAQTRTKRTTATHEDYQPNPKMGVSRPTPSPRPQPDTVRI